MTMGSRGPLLGDSGMTTFSALHLLRSYNHLLTPASTGNPLLPGYAPYGLTSPPVQDIAPLDRDNPPGLQTRFDFPPILAPFHGYPPMAIPAMPPSAQVSLDQHKTSSGPLTPTLCMRRPRGEKKPIPDDQKDDRYYERRKRNNQAAKKSRDARKLREDQIALRATILEHENAVLRAQNLTLREEAQSLRHLLILQRKEALAPSRGSEPDNADPKHEDVKKN